MGKLKVTGPAIQGATFRRKRIPQHLIWCLDSLRDRMNLPRDVNQMIGDANQQRAYVAMVSLGALFLDWLVRMKTSYSDSEGLLLEWSRKAEIRVQRQLGMQ